MPLSPLNLPAHLVAQLRAFFATFDFAAAYRSYDWGDDNWAAGFPVIATLERRFAAAPAVGRPEIEAVTTWGRYRGRWSVDAPFTLPLSALVVHPYPDALVRVVREHTTGLGPTYASKIARFAQPAEFGAIDTRLVRVFGQGDAANQRHAWLPLRVTQYTTGRWAIQAPDWERGYALWINVLRWFAQELSAAGVACPHPEGFLLAAGSPRGEWRVADVEMALFAWASGVIAGQPV